MTERSEGDVLTGVLRIPISGTVREVPTLKAKWIAAWGEMLAGDDRDAKPLGEWTMHDVAALSGRTVEHLLDLIVAYDRTAALGGREWLEENADPRELNDALVAMVGNAYPLADDAAGLVSLMMAHAAARSDQPSSTSGSSTSGASTRKRSARASTRSS